MVIPITSAYYLHQAQSPGQPAAPRVVGASPVTRPLGLWMQPSWCDSKKLNILWLAGVVYDVWSWVCPGKNVSIIWIVNVISSALDVDCHFTLSWYNIKFNFNMKLPYVRGTGIVTLVLHHVTQLLLGVTNSSLCSDEWGTVLCDRYFKFS